MNKEFYETLLENLYDGIYYVDRSKTITFWNKSAERISGYTKEEVMNRQCSDNILRHIDIHGVELCLKGCPLGKTILDGKIRDSDIFLHHKDGHRVPVSVRVSPIYDDNNNIIGAVEIFTDNSKRESILLEMEQLQKEALTDTLTGLGNRKYFEMNLTNKFNDLLQYDVQFGLLFLDIDHFKSFNDTYGHDTGDKVLTMVAKTISNTLRKLDVVCRWGGEEFIILTPNVTREKLQEIAERIRVFVERSWITEKDKNLKVTVSIGGTMATIEDSRESIVKRADELMYTSKENGRNRATVE